MCRRLICIGLVLGVALTTVLTFPAIASAGSVGGQAQPSTFGVGLFAQPAGFPVRPVTAGPPSALLNRVGRCRSGGGGTICELVDGSRIRRSSSRPLPVGAPSGSCYAGACPVVVMAAAASR